jgi:hypothetical protein
MWRAWLCRRNQSRSTPSSSPTPAFPQRRRSTGADGRAGTPPCDRLAFAPASPLLITPSPGGRSLTIQLPWRVRSRRWRTPRIAAGSSSARQRLAPRGSLPALGRPSAPVSLPAPTPPQVKFSAKSRKRKLPEPNQCQQK